MEGKHNITMPQKYSQCDIITRSFFWARQDPGRVAAMHGRVQRRSHVQESRISIDFTSASAVEQGFPLPYMAAKVKVLPRTFLKPRVQ